MRRRLRRLVRWGTALYVVLWCGNRSARDVEGHSMRPALHAGDRILVLPAGLLAPRRGSVVVVPDPRDPRRRTVKRVVGLPGEVVELVDGRLRIDGVPHDEPYVVAGGGPGGRWRTGAGELVVLGDDRGSSTDSRVFGPVASADVLAVGVAKLRPAGRLRRLPPVPTPVRDRGPG